MERRYLPSIAFWWVIWAAAALVLRLLSPGILEMGDGVLHYQMARYSWEHPELLLDNWGKPLFTLLASPFAQLGHWGMTLFNALCFTATCWAADRMLRETAPWTRWLFPPALLLVPVYGAMVLEGMTEVLFGLLAILVVLALYTKHFRTAAVVASFMPFARPEYIAFLPCVALFIGLQRRWFALPFLLVGHALYAIVGGLVFGDVFWAFSSDPYTGAETIYGSGSFWHFIQQVDVIYAWPLLMILALALPATFLLRPMDSDLEYSRRTLLLTALLPAIGILIVHSFLWWQGAKGSLGLARVLATTAPLLMLFSLWMIGRVWHVFNSGRVGGVAIGMVLSAVYVVFAVKALVALQPLPIKAGAYQRFVDRVGQRVGELVGTDRRVVYFHPYIAYRAALDPFDKEHSWRSWPGEALRENDLIVWDAHFGPNEGGVPLDRLRNDTTLRLLEVMVPDERMEVLGGHAFEVFLFERSKARRVMEEDTLFVQALDDTLRFAHRKDTMPCAIGTKAWCFGAGEFPFEIDGLPVDVPDMLYAELSISGKIAWEGERKDATNLIFTEDAASGQLSYWSTTLEEGPFNIRLRIPPRNGIARNKLYFWNLSGSGFRLQEFELRLVVHRPAL
jgi:hypothetical protein